MTDEPTRNPCELAAPAAVPPGYVLVPVNELADLRERAGFNDHRESESPDFRPGSSQGSMI